MNGRDFIQIASRFVTIGEAGSRSATSRAYYGAFHAALELFEELDCAIPRSGKAHNLVPICLSESNVEEAKLAGLGLNRLHTKRIKADYRLDDATIGRTDAGRLSVESASDITQFLDILRDKCDANDSLRDEFVNETRRTIDRISP